MKKNYTFKLFVISTFLLSLNTLLIAQDSSRSSKPYDQSISIEGKNESNCDNLNSNIIISEKIDGTVSIDSSKNIYAFSEFTASSNVELVAGNEIILRPGFKVAKGAEFTASIEDYTNCNVNGLSVHNPFKYSSCDNSADFNSISNGSNCSGERVCDTTSILTSNLDLLLTQFFLEVNCKCIGSNCSIDKVIMSNNYQYSKEFMQGDNSIEHGSFPIYNPVGELIDSIEFEIEIDVRVTFATAEIKINGVTLNLQGNCVGNCGSGVSFSNSEKIIVEEHEKYILKESNLGMTISPNPSQGLINLSLQIPESNDLNIHIYSSEGKTIYNQSTYVIKGNYQKAIELPNTIPSGMYFINATVGKNKIVRKLIISK